MQVQQLTQANQLTDQLKQLTGGYGDSGGLQSRFALHLVWNYYYFLNPHY